jgi:hypothetical protein
LRLRVCPPPAGRQPIHSFDPHIPIIINQLQFFSFRDRRLPISGPWIEISISVFHRILDLKRAGFLSGPFFLKIAGFYLLPNLSRI